MPPRTSASGYKAADWNVEQFMWKGRLKVVEIGSRCELKLEVGLSFNKESWTMIRQNQEERAVLIVGQFIRRAVRFSDLRPPMDTSRTRP